MNTNTKETVVSRFLDFVARHCSLKTAQLATLGGKGVEATVWAARGIPASNGWLIERSRGRQKELAEDHSYKSCNQLSGFTTILRGEYQEPKIDGFHLDLQGTLPPTLEAFKPALELVLHGAGRCLAVTVADARRNLTIEDWPKFEIEAEKVFGKRVFNSFFRTLVAEQRGIPVKKHLKRVPSWLHAFSPEKGAQREAGLALELAHLFVGYNLPKITDMQRYVYVSRYSGRPFRMRTYFFHFSESSGTIREYVEAWGTSQLKFVDEEGEHAVANKASAAQFVESEHAKQTKTKKTEVRMSVKMDNQQGPLAQLVALTGNPAIKAEYDKLVADTQAYSSLMQTIAGHLPGGATVVATKLSTNGTQEPQEPTVLRAAHKRAVRNDANIWDALSEQDRIKALITIRELKATSGGKWKKEQWEQLVAMQFGSYSPDRGVRLRASLARSCGKHRESFERRIRELFPKAEAQALTERYHRSVGLLRN